MRTAAHLKERTPLLEFILHSTGITWRRKMTRTRREDVRHFRSGIIGREYFFARQVHTDDSLVYLSYLPLIIYVPEYPRESES